MPPGLGAPPELSEEDIPPGLQDIPPGVIDQPSSAPWGGRARRPEVDPIELRVVKLLNEERLVLGLTPLTVDAIAVKVARAHSKDMCQRRYFSHASPEGTRPWHRLRRAGARFRAAAENIAAGHRTARNVHHGWLASPGHRKNRLNPRHRRIGVGLHMCGDTPYWTELFMR